MTEPGSSSEALGRLVDAYASDVALGLAGDERVVGYVGQDVPEELLAAAGVRALRLRGRPGWDLTRADTYLGTGVDAASRALLAGLLEDRFGELLGVAISSDCEASRQLFYVLRELHRVEPDVRLPPVHLLDILHQPRETTARYNAVRIGQFLEVVAAWTGVTVGPAAIASAVADHDEERRLLRAVIALRRARPARLTGREALAVLGVKGRLGRAEFKRLLGALAQGDDLPAHDGRRVFVTGSSHDSPAVYDAIERGGAVVVGEDHDWGELWVERDVGEATIDALARRYRDNGPTPQRASMQQRAAHTKAAAERCGAELLLGYWREHDEAPGWDFGHQAAAVPIPSAEIGRQRYGQVDPDALAVALVHR